MCNKMLTDGAVLVPRERAVAVRALLRKVLRPVDQVEVQVLQLQVGQGLLGRRQYVGGRVLTVPQLRRDEDVLALDCAGGENLGEDLADLRLVAVARSAVDVLVPAQGARGRSGQLLRRRAAGELAKFCFAMK